MPSPRAGTVTPDVAKVIKEYKAGKVEFRCDAGGNVHAVVGKMSFEATNRGEYFGVHQLHPAPQAGAVKGQYVKGIAIKGTMSPALRIQAARDRRNRTPSPQPATVPVRIERRENGESSAQ